MTMHSSQRRRAETGPDRQRCTGDGHTCSSSSFASGMLKAGEAGVLKKGLSMSKQQRTRWLRTARCNGPKMNKAPY